MSSPEEKGLRGQVSKLEGEIARKRALGWKTPEEWAAARKSSPASSQWGGRLFAVLIFVGLAVLAVRVVQIGPAVFARAAARLSGVQ